MASEPGDGDIVLEGAGREQDIAGRSALQGGWPLTGPEADGVQDQTEPACRHRAAVGHFPAEASVAVKEDNLRSSRQAFGDARELLPRFGLEPMRDVILRAIEPPPNRLTALLSGAVDAAVLTHPETIIARKQGYQELLFFGDHIEFVSAGVVATEKNIAQRPDFVRRFIRGALKTFYWLKANEKEVAGRLAKATKTSDSDGLDLYRTGVKLFSQDGSIPRSLQERMIAMQRKVLQIEKEIAPESVYDFSFVRAANKELGKGD